MFSLSFRRPHRSIHSLNDTQLPDFTVLTGENGSGKTHLLEAIANGHIAVDGKVAGGEDIKLFNWTNFAPLESQVVDPVAQKRSRDEYLNAVCDGLRHARDNFSSQMRMLPNVPSNAGFTELLHMANTPSAPQNPTASPAPQPGVFGVRPSIDQQMRQRPMHFKARLQELENATKNAFSGNTSLLEKAIAHSKSTKRHIAELERKEIGSLAPLNWEVGDIFGQNLSQIFARYHAMWDDNHYAQYANERHHENNDYLSDNEFILQYGDPPWDLVNKILKIAHLNYRVDYPKGRSGVPFQANLIHTETGNRVAFQDLSSGEKVLMSFALCMYNSSDSVRVVNCPRMLLFDEVDAPLHPSMSRDLISVIGSVLVKDRKVKVILSTHSPATVAFASMDSIHQMRRTPREVAQVSKERAIEILTSGYISVTESSRFVLCEAKYDRNVFTELARSLFEAGHLRDAPKLIFIQATDNKNLSGGGRGQVEQWGTKLANAGLPGILGLIDRDQGNLPTNAVKVLPRYSIENFLLDPIVCYAVLVDHGFQSVVNADGIGDRNYFALAKFDDVKLQKIVDGVAALVEKHNQNLKEHAGVFEVAYVGGGKVNLPIWMRDTRGHDLVGFVRDAFRHEIADKKFVLTGAECSELVEMMTQRLPQFIPCELLEVFQSLQEAARATT